MTTPAYILTSTHVTVLLDGVTHTLGAEHPNFQAVRDAIKSKNFDQLPNLVNISKGIETFVGDQVRVENGSVYYGNEEVKGALVNRILDMMQEGFDATPMCKFLENLMRNPSKSAVDELYLWLEQTALPITEDGCFMAYKKVRDDYLDFYTGKVLNKPAALMTDADLEYIKMVRGNVTVSVEDGVTTLTMPRNKVDDNRDRTCSYGLHFCSLSYLPAYHGGQGRVLLVKIDPADVVSIPSDYDNAKGRAMRYQIMAEHVKAETTEAYSTPVATATGEARVSARKAEPQAELKTWVLGVNFGTEDRAAQVRALMEACVNQAGEVRSVAQARVDGFDDAWYNKAADLHRYTGSHIREAVEYAQAYFEGYDRCRGNAPQVQAAISEPVTAADEYAPATAAQRDEILRVLNAPITGAETLHGRYDGDSDGFWDGVNDRDAGRKFDLTPALRGGRNYRKAYIEAYTEKFNAG
jgi:hypothetical protein